MKKALFYKNCPFKSQEAIKAALEPLKEPEKKKSKIDEKKEEDESTNPKMEYIKDVGKASLAGFLTIVQALETASETVGSSFG